MELPMGHKNKASNKGRPITSPTAPPEWREGIKQRMGMLSLTGKKLAEYVGYAPVTVQTWLNGSVRLSEEKAQLLEEGIDRFIAETRTTLTLVEENKIEPTTWSTQPQGKKGKK